MHVEQEFGKRQQFPLSDRERGEESTFPKGVCICVCVCVHVVVCVVVCDHMAAFVAVRVPDDHCFPPLLA